MDQANDKEVEIRVINAVGKEILQAIYPSQAQESFETKLTFENLEPGIYFVQIKNRRGSNHEEISNRIAKSYGSLK